MTPCCLSAIISKVAEDALKREHIPDEAAIIGSEAESGIKKEWDDIFHKEEQGSHVVVHGRIPGGGEGGLDRLFDKPQEVSPEILLLQRDFFIDTYGVNSLEELARISGEQIETLKDKVKGDFLSWINSEDSDFTPSAISSTLRAVLKKDFPYYLELDIDPNTVSDFDYFKLRQLWGRPETKVLYVFGPQPNSSDDEIIFTGEGEKGKELRVEVPMSILQSRIASAKLGLKRSFWLGRPTNGRGRERFWEKLKELTLEGEPLRVNSLQVRYPVDLQFDEKYLSGRVDEEPAFWAKTWRNAWTDTTSKIKAVGVLYRNGSVKSIALDSERYGSVALPFWLFRKAFGVRRFEAVDNGINLEGGRFGSLGIPIAPGVGEEQVKDVIRSMTVDGVPFRKDAKVVIARVG